MAERLDDLQYKGLVLLQDTDEFCFGCDAVELAHFARVKAGARVADIGAGTGVISVLLAAQQGAHVCAVECNPVTADLCRRSVDLNGLTDRIEVHCMRAQDSPARLGRTFDAVVSNPPYFKQNSGFLHETPSVAAARHELTLTLDELTSVAAALLDTGGAFYVVYPADRLAELIASCAMRRLQPKMLQILTPAAGKPPHLCLLRCTYNGRPGLKILPERPVRAYGMEG